MFASNQHLKCNTIYQTDTNISIKIVLFSRSLQDKVVIHSALGRQYGSLMRQNFKVI